MARYTEAQQNLHKRAMLKALESTLGVVTLAAKKAQIERTTHYKWMESDPEYKAKVKEVENMAIDFAESKLHGLIDGGDTAATIFYLKTKGKSRGYIERNETAIVDGEIKIVMPKIPKKKK